MVSDTEREGECDAAPVRVPVALCDDGRHMVWEGVGLPVWLRDRLDPENDADGDPVPVRVKLRARQSVVDGVWVGLRGAVGDVV